MSHLKEYTNVKVSCDSPVSNYAKLTVNDSIIPFYEMNINMTVDNFVTVTVKVPADSIDIEALQEHTRIEIVDNRTTKKE